MRWHQARGLGSDGLLGDRVRLHLFSFVGYTAVCTNTDTIWKSSRAGYFQRDCEGHFAWDFAIRSDRLMICGF